MKQRTWMHACLAFLIAALLMGCDTITDPDPVQDPTPPATYRLIWADEFDQTSTTPLAANWNYDLGYGYSNSDGWGNDEWQNYTDTTDNVRVENGQLIITAKWDSANYPVPGKRNGSITSGRINTKNKFSVKYGKVQARIKLPRGTGMWPAFWMLGDNFDDIGWPACGEMDIVEMTPLYHDDKTSLCTIHWADGSNAHTSYQGIKVMENSLADDFHVYELEWDAQRIVGRIDNMTYMVKVIDQETMNEFLNEFFIILNVAVGGNFVGAPDETTPWPQSMTVDWVRVYQKEQSGDLVETFGIFTDTTPVDAGITPGANAEIYVWENTLAQGTIAPYEGDNCMSWVTTGAGWFGAGIQSDNPLDMSDFRGGNMNLMIRMPAGVTFDIGISDTNGHESYVAFPANTTAWGLERNGEWGRAAIPITAFTGIDLTSLSYAFMIREQQGTQCQFAVDDIFWNGGGNPVTEVHLDSDTYRADTAEGLVTVADEGATGTTVNVAVDNGQSTITVPVAIGDTGTGSATIHFGPTDDTTDTIEIATGMTLTVTYIDQTGNTRTDSAPVLPGAPTTDTFGVFTDTTPVTSGLTVGVDAQIFVWENTLASGTIPPYEGENGIAWHTTGANWFGAGVMANQAVDLSAFAGGSIRFMIRMPANVTFRIGVVDAAGHENYAIFPASQTAFGLERNGEWGQAVIPLNNLITNVSLTTLRYVFTILSDDGSQCEFGIDDIYWVGPTGKATRLNANHTPDRMNPKVSGR